MSDHMEPSFWGMVICNGGPFLFAIFLTIVIGVDPMTMAMG
jgi:hypothetical protein